MTARLVDPMQSDHRLLRKKAVIAAGKTGPDAKAALPVLTARMDEPIIGFHARLALGLIQGD